MSNVGPLVKSFLKGRLLLSVGALRAFSVVGANPHRGRKRVPAGAIVG
jgi:hypothetical protein